MRSVSINLINSVILLMMMAIIVGCESDDSEASGDATVTGNVVQVNGQHAVAAGVQSTILVYIDDYADMQSVELGGSFTFSNVSEGDHTLTFVVDANHKGMRLDVGREETITVQNIRLSDDNIVYDDLLRAGYSSDSQDGDGQGEDEDNEDREDIPRELSYRSVDRVGTFSESFTAVIRSEDEWSDLRSTYTTGWQAVPAISPDVDFNNEMLIFISGGMRTSLDMHLAMKSVTLTSSSIIVDYQSWHHYGETAQALCWPALLFAVPRYDLPVVFNAESLSTGMPIQEEFDEE